MTIRHLLIALMGIAANIGTVRAAPKPLEPPTMLRFYYIAMIDVREPEPELAARYRIGSKFETLGVGPSGFSPLIEYRGPREVVLYHPQPPNADPKAKDEEAARIALPPDWKGALILVAHDQRNSRFPFRFRAIEYWAPPPPIREVRVMNLCPAPLAGRLNGSTLQVAVGQWSDVPLDAARDRLGIRLALRRPSMWQPVLSTVLPLPRGARSLVLVYPDALQGDTARALVLDDLPGPPPDPVSHLALAASAPAGRR